MIEFVDNLLDRITMYRLVLYYLVFLLSAAVLLSIFGVLTFDPFALVFTIAFLLIVCAITNYVFARTFGVPANAESTYISALILALIITPLQAPGDLWFLLWAGVWAMASKYIVAINRKHIFNPVALAVALTYLAINQSASWWVGSGPMLPFALAGGMLVVRKLRRTYIVTSFLAAVLVTTMAFSLFDASNFLATIQKIVLYSPLFFFSFIILTEPLTSPPTRWLGMVYGALVGFLSAPQIHLGGLYVTPELAILAGNLFSFIASPKKTLVLKLKEKVQLAPDVFEFVFASRHKLAFAPGQYMEWTLGHDGPDSRGNRRYFTLASSPTEEQLRLGVKFYKKSSTFKQALLSMDSNDEIVASQLAGEFVLPKDPNQKCVFIAGGIGITPFRSMLKYLLDTGQRRPITMFYVNRSDQDAVYTNILARAERELGIRTVYTVTDSKNVPSTWRGRTGRITPQMIKDQVPDYRNCLFYISGSRRMIDSFRRILASLHVKDEQIKTDFFPGLA